MDNNEKKRQNDNNQPKMPKFNMNWIYTVILVSLGILFITGGGDALAVGSSAKQEATYTKFKEYVEKGYAKSVVVNKDRNMLTMYVNAKNIRDVFGKSAKQVGPEPAVNVEFGSVDELEKYLTEMQKAGKITDFSYENEKGNSFMNLLINLSPFILGIALWILLMRRMGGGNAGGGVFSVGKSKARMYEKGNDLGITFKDVAGQAAAKQEVQEIVEFLKEPQKYTDLGGKIPKGALLIEMDGFGTNSGVIILAATNRADMLDKALLRAGRFDRQINVDLPDLNERKEIFQVHLRPVKTDDTVDIDFLSRQTPGFSGADIANVCNEAALIAARHNKKSVGKQDFLDAVDRIIGGLEKKTKVMTYDEKRTIALHEAGHATVSWFCEYANPLVKVSIVPRGRALGAAWYLPEEYR